MTQSHKTRSWRSRWFSLIGIIGLLIVVGVWIFLGTNPMHNRNDWPTQFQSNGERIYFTAMSASGSAISASGGSTHMRMMGGGCANCHGANREGGTLRPQFWKQAPPLTAEALFGEQEHNEQGSNGNESDHGNHDLYTEESIREAITRGIDPSGQPLDPAMPRWLMSEADLVDLIAYLKGPSADTR